MSVTLYASADPSLVGATQLTATVRRTAKLKAGASKTFRLALSAFPATLVGSYNLLAAVTSPDGTTAVAIGPSVTVSKPVVTILASNATGSPTTVAPAGRLRLGLTLQNNGNIQAMATAGLTISLSASPSGMDSQAIATVPLRVKLKAGQSKAYRVKFKLPRGTAAGSYYLVASLAVSALGDSNPADGIAVSSTPIVAT